MVRLVEWFEIVRGTAVGEIFDIALRFLVSEHCGILIIDDIKLMLLTLKREKMHVYKRDLYSLRAIRVFEKNDQAIWSPSGLASAVDAALRLGAMVWFDTRYVYRCKWFAISDMVTSNADFVVSFGAGKKWIGNKYVKMHFFCSSE